MRIPLWAHRFACLLACVSAAAFCCQAPPRECVGSVLRTLSPSVADSTWLLGPERFRCWGRPGLDLDLRATSMKFHQGGGSRPGAALARGGGARAFCRSVLLVQIRAQVCGVSAVRPDTPPLPLPHVLVAQGLELRFDLAMMVHILLDVHVLAGSFPLGPRVAVLPVPLQPPHKAADDSQDDSLGNPQWP